MRQQLGAGSRAGGAPEHASGRIGCKRILPQSSQAASTNNHPALRPVLTCWA